MTFMWWFGGVCFGALLLAADVSGNWAPVSLLALCQLALAAIWNLHREKKS
ncbi:MAG: hypothetical protein GY720_15825 [bacterium]|nr:hypothetical protein [bacterium]